MRKNIFKNTIRKEKRKKKVKTLMMIVMMMKKNIKQFEKGETSYAG